MGLAAAAAFEPKAGRPMRGYTVLPPDVVSEDAALRQWLECAVAYDRSLPAKR